MSTTPQSALEALICLTPLHTYVVAKARSTAYRLRHTIKNVHFEYTNDHSSALRGLYEYVPILTAPNDYIKPVFIFERNFEVAIPNKHDFENGNTWIDYHTHVYFADGSVRKTNSAYCVYIANNQTTFFGQCGQ